MDIFNPTRPTTNPDLQRAMDAIRKKQAGYTTYRRYYEGDHPLLFATQKFRDTFGSLFSEMAFNLCATVVDTLSERLDLKSFKVTEGGDATTEADLWEIWTDNHMDQRAGDVYQEAAATGDGYVIVWPSPEDPAEPTIYPQPADIMHVQYSDDVPGKILWAAKAWRTDDGYFRVTLYYPDRLEKYVTRRPAGQGKPAEMPQKASNLVPYTLDGVWPEPNEYGAVPVFHFPNNAPLGAFGKSELRDVIPLQNALNKTLCDMLVTNEFGAFPQRWGVGIEIDNDPTTGAAKTPFKPGIDRFWTVASELAKFGQFTTADAAQYLQVAEFFGYGIARVSGRPLHYIMPMINPPSGEALKTLEEKFTTIIQKREAVWGTVWAEVALFCLLISGKSTTDTDITAVWENAEPISELQQAQTIMILEPLVGKREALRMLGKTEQQIKDILAEQQKDAAEALKQAQAQASSMMGANHMQPVTGGGLTPPMTMNPSTNHNGSAKGAEPQGRGN